MRFHSMSFLESEKSNEPFSHLVLTFLFSVSSPLETNGIVKILFCNV